MCVCVCVCASVLSDLKSRKVRRDLMPDLIFLLCTFSATHALGTITTDTRVFFSPNDLKAFIDKHYL